MSLIKWVHFASTIIVTYKTKQSVQQFIKRSRKSEKVHDDRHRMITNSLSDTKNQQKTQ